jgi:hypothetical protein
MKKFIALENRIQSDEAVIASIQEVIDETKAELAEVVGKIFNSDFSNNLSKLCFGFINYLLDGCNDSLVALNSILEGNEFFKHILNLLLLWCHRLRRERCFEKTVLLRLTCVAALEQNKYRVLCFIC